MTDSAQLRAQLSSEINEENAVADALLAIMTRKQRMVVSGDVSGLRDAIGEEQALARKMGDLVTRRVELVRLAAREYDLGDSPLTLSDLARHFDGADRQEWAGRVRNLRENLEKVQNLNRENQRLVAVCMQLNREMFKTLFPNIESKPGTYSKSGKMEKGGQGKQILDWQV
ncbi:MAG TPA: flagellar protein FlgN [Calditrichia bacterium]|nr:flagellar protein FlgN [Calditrichota bacterium]HQU72441.1 flagellar protein FlgN [Calditrichia bacterium]HQV30976.1 flagellar protein FlgN [Calditrichia bacterium]